jgi:glycerol-3-phosphate dehydrogenase
MALAAPGPGGRMLTLVPWRGRALVGTSQSSSLAQPDDLAVRRSEVDSFIAEVNHAFPALALSAEDVTLVHRGIVPAVQRGGAPDLKASTEILDHARDGAPGAITVIGAKYTTARGVAERVGDLVGKRLGRRLPRSRTAMTPLPGAGIADHEGLAIETARAANVDVPQKTLAQLTHLYAERAADVIRLMRDRDDLRAPVAAGVQTIGAEVVYTIREEMAVRLADIVIRRTGLGSAGPPPHVAVERCAQIAAAELGWDETRTADEVSKVARFYAIDEG